jgi:hypothetical protein
MLAGFIRFSSSPASGRPALHESLFYISVPRWIFLLTFFPGMRPRTGRYMLRNIVREIRIRLHVRRAPG